MANEACKFCPTINIVWNCRNLKNQQQNKQFLDFNFTSLVKSPLRMNEIKQSHWRTNSVLYIKIKLHQNIVRISSGYIFSFRKQQQQKPNIITVKAQLKLAIHVTYRLIYS